MGIESGIKTTCAPVTEAVENGIEIVYHQDFSKPVELTVVNEFQGYVVCPLFKDKKCNGEKPCVTNEIDIHTTVIGKDLSTQTEAEHIPHLPMSLYHHYPKKD